METKLLTSHSDQTFEVTVGNKIYHRVYRHNVATLANKDETTIEWYEVNNIPNLAMAGRNRIWNRFKVAELEEEYGQMINAMI